MERKKRSRAEHALRVLGMAYKPLSEDESAEEAERGMVWAVIASFAMCIPLIYVPFFQDRFHTFPLSLLDWAIVILSSATIFIVLETTKLIIRRHDKELREETP
ncbi:MAG: cation-translocating P-type ATPase C-terminal domain-containing protein [Thermodesulfobacteriota bacterium]|nr:cation-translocating P-type ATPase C-terminal domain-containing protein [Thermodesulfobacteriota bacterium]